MALNLVKGHVIAKIKGGKLNGQLLRVTPEGYTGSRTFDKLALPDGKFVPYPDVERERDTYYIVGSSGSGKSYFTKQYAMNYQVAYKNKRPIYLFSKVMEDPSLEGVDLKRVKWKNFTSPEKAKEFYEKYAPDSLVIFDDVDTISSGVKQFLKLLKDDILEMGRHQNTSFVGLAHLGSRSNETRRDLAESQVIVVFPQSLSGTNERMLRSHAGLSLKEVEAIKRKIKSRSIMLHRHIYPPVWVSEREAGMIRDLEEYVAPPLKGGGVEEIEAESPNSWKCECGGRISKINASRHRKSKRHRLHLAREKEEQYRALIPNDEDLGFE